MVRNLPGTVESGGFTSYWGSFRGFPKLRHVDVRNDFVEFASEEEEWYSGYFRHEVYGPPFFAAEKWSKVIQSWYAQTKKNNTSQHYNHP